MILEFGGLTVLKEIKKNLPNEDLIYLGDTLNFPYGSKNKEDIIKYAIDNTKFLISQNVKMIIIACGTATSYALNTLQNRFDIPIIGIIEPTVSHIKTLGLEQIGVIATEGTIKSKAWENAIKKEMPNIEVISKACPMLATIAEEGRARSEEGKKAIKEYMRIFKEKKINNIILGCTHYPIYYPIIREELEYEVNLINTGVTVSKYLTKHLDKKDVIEKGTEKIFLSEPSEKFLEISEKLLDIS